MSSNRGIQFVRILRPSINHEICPKCNGTGEEEFEPAIIISCTLCDGKGQIDWITYMRYKGSEFHENA